jgi:hypothetical protein
MRKEKPVTNGDMFFTIFPQAVKSNFVYSDEDMKDYVLIYLNDYDEMKVSYDWWTAPYNEGGKGEEK